MPAQKKDASQPQPHLKFILFKRGGKFRMAACRGLAKGCNVLEKQRQKLGPCPDCIECDDNETVGDILKRVNKGDA